MDIIYCACIFHSPLYALAFCLDEKVANMYLSDLNNLEGYNKNIKLDRKRNLIFISTNLSKNIPSKRN